MSFSPVSPLNYQDYQQELYNFDVDCDNQDYQQELYNCGIDCDNQNIESPPNEATDNTLSDPHTPYKPKLKPLFVAIKQGLEKDLEASNVFNEAKIDYLSFTFPIEPDDAFWQAVKNDGGKLIMPYIEDIEGRFQCIDYYYMTHFMQEVLRYDVKDYIIVNQDKGFQGFTDSYNIYYKNNGEKQLVFKYCSGQKNKDGQKIAHISFSGAGCSHIRSAANYAELYDYIVYYHKKAKITRLDIAYDVEKYDVLDALVEYKAGSFNVGGRNPFCKAVIEYSDTNSGNTVYIGKRQSGKMLRIYEKGKQLGDPDSTWVRFEVELRNTNRVINLDVIKNLGGYFVGAYPKFLTDVLKNVEPLSIKTEVKKGKITIDHLVKHLSLGYGKLINVCAQKYNDLFYYIIIACMRDGMPSRLHQLDHNNIVDIQAQSDNTHDSVEASNIVPTVDVAVPTALVTPIY